MTPGINQIKGMLLEEAILYLLRAAGYVHIDSVRNDPTLRQGSAGIYVRGRGADHQIDAIADSLIQHPFSNPQRLLVEAKHLKGNVRLPVIRNALGTLTDVNEFWGRESGIQEQDSIPKPRYHYQYAVFSAQGFAPNAQNYADAQDIFLFPLRRSRFFVPVLDIIESTAKTLYQSPSVGNVRLKDIRGILRGELGVSDKYHNSQFSNIKNILQPLSRKCREVGGILIAGLPGGFLLLLVPSRDLNINDIFDRQSVRIHRGKDGWSIYRRNLNGSEQILFSFDLPEKLFNRYAKDGRLSRRAAINLKEEMFSSFRVVFYSNGQMKILTFELDADWINEIKEKSPKED